MRTKINLQKNLITIECKFYLSISITQKHDFLSLSSVYFISPYESFRHSC